MKRFTARQIFLPAAEGCPAAPLMAILRTNRDGERPGFALQFADLGGMSSPRKLEAVLLNGTDWSLKAGPSAALALPEAQASAEALDQRPRIEASIGLDASSMHQAPTA